MFKIKKLDVHGFRGINMVNFCQPKDVNIITGNNNVGKSTILNAISLFFDAESELARNADNHLYNFHYDGLEYADKCKVICNDLALTVCFDTIKKGYTYQYSGLNEESYADLSHLRKCVKYKYELNAEIKNQNGLLELMDLFGVKQPIELIGDATKKALHLADTLLSVSECVFLIDDLYLNLSSRDNLKKTRVFFEWLVKTAKDRNIQLFITCYDLDTIDAIYFAALDNATLINVNKNKTTGLLSLKQFNYSMYRSLRCDSGLDPL